MNSECWKKNPGLNLIEALVNCVREPGYILNSQMTRGSEKRVAGAGSHHVPPQSRADSVTLPDLPGWNSAPAAAPSLSSADPACRVLSDEGGPQGPQHPSGEPCSHGSPVLSPHPIPQVQTRPGLGKSPSWQGQHCGKPVVSLSKRKTRTHCGPQPLPRGLPEPRTGRSQRLRSRPSHPAMNRPEP